MHGVVCALHEQRVGPTPSNRPASPNAVTESALKLDGIARLCIILV